MADRLTYRSSGEVVQADSELPDSLTLATNSTGNGTAAFTAFGLTKAGTGSTSALGYTNEINERLVGGGRFGLAGRVHWTSFRRSFDETQD